VDYLDRNEAISLLKELFEHHLVQPTHASIHRNEINTYSLILKIRNSLFLNAFLADKNLVLHEDKEKGICRICSP
jgi:hypothetical protein